MRMRPVRLIAPLLFFCAMSSNLAQPPVLTPPGSPTLIFASDTQEPMRIEQVFLRSHENKKATRALFRHILAQDPTELFLLGDVVNLGYKKKRWDFIDTALMLARDGGFRVHAILGNHELMGRAQRGERNFQERFPDHVRTGYVVRQDSIAVVLLNSNFSKLSKAEILLQNNWLTSTLAKLDSSQEVLAVVVCCHHSPYSNSKMVGSSPAVQDRFVTPFMKARKTRLFISGHAHLYQHFRMEEKHFFVIGGGGGLHHPVSRTPGPYVCLEPEYTPLFHYLSVQRQVASLSIVSHRLRDDLSGFDEGCTYLLAP